MTQVNSQEQTIYRNLSCRIQLGFYSNAERFPSVKELAGRYQVSCCPAQRALKALERDGLIRLCRGKETVVLAKPYEDYLNSPVFLKRTDALLDLCKSLRLISVPICCQGLVHLNKPHELSRAAGEDDRTYYSRYLYRLFEQTVHSLGSQTLESLYYDIGAFIESSFIDLLYDAQREDQENLLLKSIAEAFGQVPKEFCSRQQKKQQAYLEKLGELFFEGVEQRLEAYCGRMSSDHQERFSWEPYKGRTKYCDMIAIDMVCKINQGVYPVNALLPKSADLADVYHVSEITMRRTIALLNKLEVVRTLNGIGTRVISRGDASICHKLKTLRIDSNLKAFLEALQFFAFTSEAVIRYTLPYCPIEWYDETDSLLKTKQQKASMVAVIGTCLQAVVRYCPLSAVREIYSRITHLLLNGSILRVAESGSEQVPDWERISCRLGDRLQSKDFVQFAEEFRKMLEKYFVITKQTLLEIGVDAAANTAEPVREL